MNYDNRICVICNKEFMPKASNQLTCSPECSNERGRRKKAERYHERSIITCVMCGKEFLQTRHDQKCCSPECQKRRMIEKSQEWNNAKREEKKRRVTKSKNLDRELKRLNKYNKEHGTRLSYGQFEALGT